MSKNINSYDCYIGENSLVLTLHRGYIKIIDVTVDDFVLTHTGKWARVLELVRGKNVAVKRIKTFKTPELYVTDKQTFYTSNRKERMWKPFAKVDYDSTLCTVIPKNKVGIITQNAFWRFLGVWLKRGYFKENKAYIAVQVNKVEERFLVSVLDGLGIHYDKSKLSSGIEYFIKDSDLHSISGDFMNKNSEKVIPGFILNEDPDKLILMLEVFLDLVKFNDKKIRHIPIYNEGMAYIISLLIHKCYNIPTSINKTKLIGLDNEIKIAYIITNKFSGKHSINSVYDWGKLRDINNDVIITTGYSIVVEKYNSYLANNTMMRGFLKKSS